MGLPSLVWFLLIGLAAGWLATYFMKVRTGSLWENLLIGVVGAVLGGFLFSVLGIELGLGVIGQLITATIGAMLLLFIIRLLRDRRL